MEAKTVACRLFHLNAARSTQKVQQNEHCLKIVQSLCTIRSGWPHSSCFICVWL